jgi:hypothetical protein
MWSLADTLDRVVPRRDTALVSPPALARLRDLAGGLAAALTRRVYLESWLGRDWPRVDLIVKIDRRDRELLADPERSALTPDLQAQPSWRHVAAFARAWAEPGSLLDAGVRAAWLEFDLEPGLPGDGTLPAPRVFVDFEREAQRQPADARRRLILRAVEALSDGGAEASDEALRGCLRHLPHEATLPYLGVFVRDGQVPDLRICAVRLGAALPTYLAAIGWTGDVDDLAARVLAPLSRTQGEPTDVSVVHLDLAPDVGPRIGLEYSFPRPGRPGGLRREDAFLGELVRRGWCTARNRDALRRWPGRSVELLPHDVWHSAVTRRIGHVKVTYAPGEEIVAKGYMSVAFELLAGGTLLPGRLKLFGELSDRDLDAVAGSGDVDPTDPTDPSDLR